MRISKEERSTLLQIVRHIDPSSEVYLFGSRADDTKRGGDIDILILGQRKLNHEEISTIRWQFINHHGDQKIDIMSFKRSDNHIMKQVALTTAVAL